MQVEERGGAFVYSCISCGAVKKRYVHEGKGRIPAHLLRDQSATLRQ